MGGGNFESTIRSTALQSTIILLAVYKVRWNNYHPTTFISASADWTVRIWDSTYPNSQVMLFDMGMIVVDAMWAPYSSTVFGCATLDRIYVYDINV